MRGLFITLEGGEGAGKSTQIPRLKAYLEERGRQVVTLREPGNTPIAEEIRTILKTPRSDEKLYPETELLLMYAARAQLVRKVIKPSLEAGLDVLCDRHDLSSLAYQGGGHGLPAWALETCRKLALDGLQPDLILLLDLPVPVGMQRAAGRGSLDRFEGLGQAFMERVRTAYLEYAREHPQLVRVVDASLDPETVFKRLCPYLDEILAHAL
ncbi:MAG: dTMP kinase [Succinivibrio sp.]|nr:dTMP kinase [Succinivibrio sp.]